MKRKQKKNHNKDENMRLYRKCNDFLLLKKEEIKNASDEDIFRIALDYEIAHLTKMLSYIHILQEGIESSPPIYFRMCLELNSLYQLYLSKKLDKTNYQLFKIQGNSRDIGEKERKKIANKLGISEKVFSRVIKSNRPFYLIGAVKDYEHFRNIVIESFEELYTNSKVVEKIKKLYDFLGIQAHIAMDSMNFLAIDEEFLAGLDLFVLTFESDYKDELKKIKQIKTKPLVFNEANDEKVQLIYDKIDILKDDAGELFDDILEHPEYALDQFYEGISFAINMMKTLMVSYTEGIIYSLMPLLKVIYEKCGIIYEILLGDRNTRYRKLKRFEYSFAYAFNNANLNDDIFDLRSAEELLKKAIINAYEEDKKTLEGTNKNEYLNNIQISPVYAVFLKHKGFSEIAEEIIEIIDPEDKEELFASYIHGVKNSHSSGFSIFKNDDEFRVDILYAIKFLIIFTTKVLALLKQIIKDENIKTQVHFINYNLSVFGGSDEPIKTLSNIDFIENLQSDLRILQTTFVNHYREDVEKYITKSIKPTEDEISDISFENDNLNYK